MDSRTCDKALKVLQHLSLAALQFPPCYLITDIVRGKRIGAGGEATVYAGTCKGENVVIREFHPPRGGDWTTPEGKLVLRVSSLSLLIVCSAEAHHAVYGS